MRPPITTNASKDPRMPGDLEVFATLEAAALAYEVYDVGDPEISIFDADGRVLAFGLRRPGPEEVQRRGLLQRVLEGGQPVLGIVAVNDQPPQPERLRSLLQQHCRRSGIRVALLATTEQLLDAVLRAQTR